MTLIHAECPPIAFFGKLFLHKLYQDIFLRRRRAIHDFRIFVQEAEFCAKEDVLQVAQRDY